MLDGVAQALVRWPNEIFGRVEIRSAKAGAAVATPIGRWLIHRLQVGRFPLFHGLVADSPLVRAPVGFPRGTVAVTVAVVAVLAARDSSGRRTLRYQLEAQQAWERGDVERTKLCLQRLALLNPAEPGARSIGLAHCEGRLGNVNRAVALMQSIAPADRPGYVPAHLWQARQLMWRGHLSSEQLNLAERHLLSCLEAQPQAAEADVLTGEPVRRGEPDKAETHLRRVTAFGEPVLVLARLHASQGKTAEARAEAAIAQRFFKSRAEADPKNLAFRLHWAEATALLDQFPAAIEILHAGSKESSAPAYRLAYRRPTTAGPPPRGCKGAANSAFVWSWCSKCFAMTTAIPMRCGVS